MREISPVFGSGSRMKFIIPLGIVMLRLYSRKTIRHRKLDKVSLMRTHFQVLGCFQVICNLNYPVVDEIYVRLWNSLPKGVQSDRQPENSQISHQVEIRLISVLFTTERILRRFNFSFLPNPTQSKTHTKPKRNVNQTSPNFS